MKGFTLDKKLSDVSMVAFVAYVFYGLLYLSHVRLLVSVAVGCIVFAYSDSYPATVIAVLVTSLLYPVLAKPYGISNKPRRSVQGFQGSIPSQISERISTMRQNYKPQEVNIPLIYVPQSKFISGVGSSMSEGFANAEEEEDIEEFEDSAGKSKPAPLTEKPKKTEKKAGKSVTKLSEQGIPPVHQPSEEDSLDATDGLFKLGQIPEESKGGYHVDIGSTVVNALSSLKPDQIKAMSEDTKALIESQKTLMNLLQTFKPMMSEGKEMMDTFQSMFSPAMGATTTATNMLKTGNLTLG